MEWTGHLEGVKSPVWGLTNRKRLTKPWGPKNPWKNEGFHPYRNMGEITITLKNDGVSRGELPWVPGNDPPRWRGDCSTSKLRKDWYQRHYPGQVAPRESRAAGAMPANVSSVSRVSTAPSKAGGPVGLQWAKVPDDVQSTYTTPLK